MRLALKQYLTLLARYLKPQRLRLLLLAALLFGSIALQLASPQVVRRFIDAAQAGGTAEALLGIAILFLGVALAQQVVSVLATYLGTDVGLTTTNALRADLLEHCLHLDMAFQNAHVPGEMIDRLDGDVGVLASFFSEFLVQVAGNVLLLFGVLTLLFCVDSRVGLALAAFAALSLAVLWRMRGLAAPQWVGARAASANVFGFLEERLSGLDDICSNAGGAYIIRRFCELLRTLMRSFLRAVFLSNSMVVTMYTLFALGAVIALAAGGVLYRAGIATIGTVYLVLQYTSMIERPISYLIRQTEYLQRVGGSVIRVQELFETQSSTGEPAVGARVPAASFAFKGHLGLEFQDVSFRYAETQPGQDVQVGDADRMALCGLSFRLAPGTVLGLLGRTGSGKTTLARLLLRFYDPNSGRILLGDDASSTDIRDLTQKDLRSQVGLVTQDVQLLRATVRDNLTFFDRNVPDQHIQQVLRDLGLEKWLQSLPAGLDTKLETGSKELSAGEAQLLAFGRIFLQDPALVVLDEASSRLDPATEALIERAVDRLLLGRTAIIIAHRLSTVQRVDEIMILDSGQISEHGRRQELASNPSSHFRRLLEAGLQEVLA